MTSEEQQVEALRAGVRKLGANFDDGVLQATRALYAPCLPAADPDCVIRTDLAYGEHPRQRLDVYLPQIAGAAPVLLYVPGGGFVGGDKAMGQGFYANVGRWFAQQGFLVAVMNYRLAPAAPWPAGSDDVASAIEWLARHADAHGGDARNIRVIGQSAGATHVAGVLFDERFDGAAAHLRSAVLMSGFYEAQAPLRPGPLAYFGADAQAYAQRSPLRLARTGHVPLLLTVAEFDPAAMARHTLWLADRLTELDGHCPPLLRHDGHNHVSTVFSIGTPQDDVARALLAFLRSPAPPA